MARKESNMTIIRVLMAFALLLSTSLIVGCDEYSLFRDSTPGVYKGRPDVHEAVDPEQRRKQLQRRLWATQRETL